MKSENPQDHLFGLFSTRRKGGDTVLELKVELDKTPVRRVVSIPAHFTLGDLHRTIQVAMGWSDAHLHEFNVQDKRYGEPAQQDPDFADELPTVFDEGNQKLTTVFDKASVIHYLYDFGDHWEHTVSLLSRRAPSFHGAPLEHRAPCVISGTGACPPEDIGGIGGYEEICELADAVKRGNSPTDAEEGALNIARRYDPRKFNLDYANDLLHGAFYHGDDGARTKRDAAIEAETSGYDRLRRRQDPTFLVARPVVPALVTAAAKKLKSVSTSAPDSAGLAGFFCGLHAAPSLVPPSEWINHLLDFPYGENEVEFPNNAAAERIMNAVFAAYNEIGSAMQEGTLPLPFLYTSDATREMDAARRWATGFFVALSLVPDISPVTSQTNGERAISILGMLHGEMAETMSSQSTRPRRTAENLRRDAMWEVPEQVSYLYQLGKKLTAAAATAGPPSGRPVGGFAGGPAGGPTGRPSPPSGARPGGTPPGGPTPSRTKKSRKRRKGRKR